jgi:hypothetical protein
MGTVKRIACVTKSRSTRNKEVATFSLLDKKKKKKETDSGEPHP